MIFPIHRVILPGRSEKNRTSPKKISEKTQSAAVYGILSPISGTIPVVNDVVAHLGIAKKGPMVR